MASDVIPVVDDGLGSTTWLVDLGGLALRGLATPGHTDEHLSFLLLGGPRPLGVLTGGSLIVGAAARTDLVGPARTEELARAQWRSLQRLVALPDEVQVWPTHGTGSFCSAPAGSERSSTIGQEKAGNVLLRAGGEVIDVRPVEAFAAGHIDGAVSIPLRDAFATWLGWTTDPQAPLVFVRDADQDPSDVRQRSEFSAGHLPASVNVELGALAEGAPADAGPGVVVGGPEDWAQATGQALALA